jgi:rhodanese-related sulfurtransferase
MKGEHMKTSRKTLILTLCLVFAFSGLALAGEIYVYEKAMDHPGGDVTPAQAYDMLQKDPNHTFLVDVRSRPEYEFLGHPEGAYNIPIKFWNGKLGEKGYGMDTNDNFTADLKARFNPKTDTLLFMCRSGHRSCAASIAAEKSNWPADKLFNIMGGYEGNKMKNPASIYDGKRVGGGWKNEGLPWTYGMDMNLVYKPDTMK